MTARLAHPVRVLGALVVLVLAGVTLGTSPASAHATLVGSTPEQGAELAAAPSRVSFEFSESMSAPAYVVVTPPDGSAAVVGDPVVDGNVVTQDVRPGAPEGTWTTAVRAVSEDGHPVTSQITFTVGEGGGPAAAPTDAPDSPEPAPAAESAAADDRSGWTRGRTDLAVGLGLFALAGLLLVLARRAPR